MNAISTSLRDTRTLDLLSGFLSLAVVAGGFLALATVHHWTIAAYFFMLTVVVPLRPVEIAGKRAMAAFCLLMVALAIGGSGAVVAIAYRDTYVFAPPVVFYLGTVPAILLAAYALGIAWVSFRSKFRPSETKTSVAWLEGRE